VGEYRDALGVLTPSEESRVLVEENWDVEIERVQEREMQGVQLFLSILIFRYRSDSGKVPTPDGRPGRRRPEGDVPVSFGDYGDVSSLAGGVSSLLGRALTE